MIYIALLAIVAALGAGFYGGYSWESGRWAKADQARMEAQATVDKQAREIEQAAANAIVDMQAAYDAGEANAKTIEKKVYVRAASDLTRYPVFQNPACVLPTDSLALLTATLKGVRAGVTLPLEGSQVAAPAPVAPPPSNARPPKPVPKKKAAP